MGVVEEVRVLSFVVVLIVHVSALVSPLLGYSSQLIVPDLETQVKQSKVIYIYLALTIIGNVSSFYLPLNMSV